MDEVSVASSRRQLRPRSLHKDWPASYIESMFSRWSPKSELTDVHRRNVEAWWRSWFDRISFGLIPRQAFEPSRRRMKVEPTKGPEDCALLYERFGAEAKLWLKPKTPVGVKEFAAALVYAKFYLAAEQEWRRARNLASDVIEMLGPRRARELEQDPAARRALHDLLERLRTSPAFGAFRLPVEVMLDQPPSMQLRSKGLALFQVELENPSKEFLARAAFFRDWFAEHVDSRLGDGSLVRIDIPGCDQWIASKKLGVHQHEAKERVLWSMVELLKRVHGTRGALEKTITLLQQTMPEHFDSPDGTLYESVRKLIQNAKKHLPKSGGRAMSNVNYLALAEQLERRHAQRSTTGRPSSAK